MAITTGKVRATYVNVFTPRKANENAEPKYSVTLLIPKNDAATLNQIYAEIEKTKQENVQKVFSGAIPPNLKTCLHDGDGYRPSGELFGRECAGCIVVTASAKQQPSIVDINLQPILDPNTVYSGCYVRASINFFAFNSNGNKGIGCGLNAIQKIEEGEPLVSRVSPEEAFGGNHAYTNQQPYSPQNYAPQIPQQQYTPVGNFGGAYAPQGQPAVPQMHSYAQPPYAPQGQSPVPPIQSYTPAPYATQNGQMPPHTGQGQPAGMPYQQSPYMGQGQAQLDPITGRPAIPGGIYGL
jgi:hypothetical protein